MRRQVIRNKKCPNCNSIRIRFNQDTRRHECLKCGYSNDRWGST